MHYTWYLIHGSWYIVPGTDFNVLLLDTSYLIPKKRLLIRSLFSFFLFFLPSSP